MNPVEVGLAAAGVAWILYGCYLGIRRVVRHWRLR